MVPDRAPSFFHTAGIARMTPTPKEERTMAKANFDTRVKREKERLQEVYSGLDDKRKAVVEGLIEEAAFMRVSLQDLKEDIKQNGDTELFCQGKEQEPYLRERPSSKKYDTRNANYQKIIKLLLEQLPKEQQTSGGDDFESF